MGPAALTVVAPPASVPWRIDPFTTNVWSVTEPALTVCSKLKLTFVLIGALRGAFSLRPSWQTALGTVVVGGIAAAIAYAVGSLFNT